MTREEIMSMAAGRTLNEWIAQHVMGIVPRQIRIQGTADHFVTFYGDNAFFQDGSSTAEELKVYGCPKSYSTDIAAAWQVVEKMEMLGHEWGVDYEGSRTDSTIGFAYVVCFGGGGDPEEERRRRAIGSSFQLCVCRAALLAVLAGKAAP